MGWRSRAATLQWPCGGEVWRTETGYDEARKGADLRGVETYKLNTTKTNRRTCLYFLTPDIFVRGLVLSSHPGFPRALKFPGLRGMTLWLCFPTATLHLVDPFLNPSAHLKLWGLLWAETNQQTNEHLWKHYHLDRGNEYVCKPACIPSFSDRRPSAQQEMRHVNWAALRAHVSQSSMPIQQCIQHILRAGGPTRNSKLLCFVGLPSCYDTDFSFFSKIILTSLSSNL